MRKILFLATIIALTISSFAQKKTLQFEDILKWERITETKISNDGSYIVYKQEPWEGDPTLYITNSKRKNHATIPYAINANFSYDSKFLFYMLNTPKDTIRALKLKKTKKEDMPQKKLAIYNFENNITEEIPYIISNKIPEKWSGWIAYQAKEKPSKKDKSFPLFIKNLTNNETKQIPAVTSYIFAKKAEVVSFISKGDSLFDAGVYVYNLKEDREIKILKSKGDIKHLNFTKDGTQLTFIADTSDAKKDYAVYLWKNEGEAKKVIDNNHEFLIENWEISKHTEPFFSDNKERLFFSTIEKKKERDTTILKEEIPVVDVWHWNEEVLHSQQLHNRKRDSKKSYLAVHHINTKKTIQLETNNYTNISVIDKGNSDYVFATSFRKYSVQTMWEGGPYYNDLYLVDINTGVSTMIKEKFRAFPRVSPKGKFLYWYNQSDTSWNTYDILNKKENKLTNGSTVQCAYELHDTPAEPGSYGIAGWFENDDAFLVYDRYGIWNLDPQNKRKPVHIVGKNDSQKLSYRLVRFNKSSDKPIKEEEPILLKAFSEITKSDSYYDFNLRNPEIPVILYEDNYSFGRPLKAKNADVIVFTKEDFETYPNLWVTNLKFKKQKQISDAAPQQKEFNWGTAELVSWYSLDGKLVEGTLHKPENFDPKKKYPMIVNFYEKNSSRLLSYRMPENHRSTIDYHYYTSNGYIVFNPDVYYEDGYPGESAYNCVMPGITTVVNMGFIDEYAIAAQGHSWGGYQVAYLATRTDMFAAIESGAPVVNMYSAYGGIRLWTGRNRSFQYEYGQSRIGKNPWESPLRYMENSPIFYLDKIQTPILIMHNEQDGAVPWAQGVEFFIGMRRLGKPCWMLNYKEGDHWPMNVRDKHDFQIRMAQFFDHYLKGKEMPEWMSKGISAVNSSQ